MPIPTKVTELIAKSGNNFHAKVARWFSENGWHVIVSPYYMDQTQNKSREIDLVAERVWDYSDGGGRRSQDVAVRLYIECKYVQSHAVFWFADKDMDSAKELVCANGPFEANNTYTMNHHYLVPDQKVAKLFATSAEKAIENEPFYKALNQALNAMVAIRGRPVSIPSLKRANHTPQVTIEYPVVVCNSFNDFYFLDFCADLEPAQVNHNFQLEVRYAYIDKRNIQKDDYFLLDMVEFGKLDDFNNSIVSDTKAAAIFLKRQ